MNTKLKLTAVAAFLALGVSSYAQQAFVRPNIGYSYSAAKVDLALANSKLGGAFNYGFDAGAAFGDQNEHELSLSLNAAEYSVSNSATGFVAPGSTDSEKLKVKTMPIMVNYRYLFGAKTDSIRYYLAPSLGYTHMKANYSFASTVPGASATDSQSKTNFTWAVGLGTEIKLADNVDLDLGYHYSDSKSFPNTPRLHVHTFSAGVSYKF